MRRSSFARTADWLFFGLLGLAFLIDLTGGARIGRDWYRLSVTDPARLLLLALIVTAVRHLVVRHPSLRDRLTARRLRRHPPDRRPAGLHAIPARERAAALALMALATAVLLHDQVFEITGVPDRGDPLFSMWRLAWVAHQIIASPLELFEANIFHPATGTFAYSDATLLPGLLATPWLWAGVPVAVVHGGLFVASFVLAGFTMFLLARAVTGRFAAAAAAGLMFAFYPYRFSTYSHIETQGVFLMPLALLFLLRLLESGRIRDGVLLGLAAAGQVLWSFYVGAYLAVGLAVAALVRWVGGHYQFRGRARALAAALLVGAAVTLPYSWPYWTARGIVGERPRDEARAFSAEPIDYTGINEVNALYGRWLHRHTTAERQLFPGFAPLVLGAAAIVPPVSPMAALAGLGALTAFDASLGLHGAIFSWLYDVAPPFRAFRVPARFGLLVGLFLALLSAIGLARLLAWRPRSRMLGAAVPALAVFASVEGRPALELMPVPTEPPPIYELLAGDPDAVIVDLPLPNDDGEYWVDPTYLYYSTFHWHRLVNGYSGFIPAWYPRLMVASRELPNDDAVAVFRRAGARYLVVHEEFYASDRYAEVTAGLEARTDLERVATRPSPAGEARLYRFLGASKAR